MQLEHFKRALCVCLALECCLVMDRRAGRWDRQRKASSCTHCTSDSLWDLCVECSGCRSRGVGRGRVGRGTQTSPTGLLRLCSRNATTATLSVKLGTDRHIAMLPLLHSSWQASRALNRGNHNCKCFLHLSISHFFLLSTSARGIKKNSQRVWQIIHREHRTQAKNVENACNMATLNSWPRTASVVPKHSSKGYRHHGTSRIHGHTPWAWRW